MRQVAHGMDPQQLQSWVYQTLAPTRVQTKQTPLMAAVKTSPKSLASIAEAVLASPTAPESLRHRLREAITASQHLYELTLPSGHGWRNKLHMDNQESCVGKARQRTSWVSGFLRHVEDGGLDDDGDLLRECCNVLHVVDPSPPPLLAPLLPRLDKPETEAEWEQLEYEVSAAQRIRREDARAVGESWLASFEYSQKHEECKQLMEHGSTHRPLALLGDKGNEEEDEDEDASSEDGSSSSSSSEDSSSSSGVQSCREEDCDSSSSEDSSSSSGAQSCREEGCDRECKKETEEAAEDCDDESEAEDAEDAEAADDTTDYAWISFKRA